MRLINPVAPTVFGDDRVGSINPQSIPKIGQIKPLSAVIVRIMEASGQDLQACLRIMQAASDRGSSSIVSQPPAWFSSQEIKVHSASV